MPLEQYPDEELTLAPWLEAIVSARVREAVAEKDTEIERLRSELEEANRTIRALWESHGP
jgi:hypothetical protein